MRDRKRSTVRKRSLLQTGCNCKISVQQRLQTGMLTYYNVTLQYRDPVSILNKVIKLLRKLACLKILTFKNIPKDVTCQQFSDEVHAALNRSIQGNSAIDFNKKDAIYMFDRSIFCPGQLHWTDLEQKGCQVCLQTHWRM